MAGIKKISIKTITELVLSLIFFLVPFHTVYILWYEKLTAPGEDAMNVWQYGVIGIYAFDILIGLLFILMSCSLVAGGTKTIRFFSLKKIHSNPLGVFLFLFVLMSIVSLFFTVQKNVALVAMLRFFEGIILFYAIKKSTLPLSRYAWILVIAGALQGVLAVWQFFNQEVGAITLLGISYHAPQDAGTSVVAYGDYRWLRAYGSFPHPNFLASFLAFSLISAWYLIRTCQKKWQLWVLLLCSISIGSGFFFAFSRNAWIGIGAGSIVWLIFAIMRRKNKWCFWKLQRIHPSIMFIGVVLVAWTFLGIQFYPLLATRIGIGGWQKLEQKSLVERRVSFQESFALIRRFPFGVGLGNDTVSQFHEDTKQNNQRDIFFYQPVHSSYLLVMRELGIQGFIVFIIFLVFLGVSLLKKIKKELADVVQKKCLYGICLMTFLVLNLVFDHFYISHASGIIVLWALLGVVYLTSSRDE